ncbi:ATP-binding protein [Iodobacter sp.]|uniref:ATP-binding protein n=1 Tax=Iodobacter sp. TaxID=1915058 RepID=UPI0025EF3A17|nr:ATP-binding protein [Iodobacter sp.]
MSLRLRLLLLIGISLSLLWGGVTAWTLYNLDRQIRHTLDQRLSMSAQMVAGLISQNAAAWDAAAKGKKRDTLLLPAGKGLACQISSLRGEVLARTDHTHPDATRSKTLGFTDLTINKEQWRSYTIEAFGLRVTTADRLSERNQMLQDVLLATTLPFMVALIGSLLLLWFGVKQGLRPLEKIRQALAGQTPQTLSPLSALHIPKDLLPLVTTLNQLLSRIEQTLERERQLTSDAAHELRTPLTAIKIHLQVARITEGEEAKTALDYAEESVARLQHTLTQLLTLAQIEGDFCWDDGQSTSTNEILKLAIRDAAPQRPERIDAGEIIAAHQLALPQALAVTALRNLLDNALNYSPANSVVRVEIHYLEDAICFCIIDQGPGLQPAELALVTQRFWRRSSTKGSGLGLSIVAAIAKRFNGKLELSQHEHGGVNAMLTLPILR